MLAIGWRGYRLLAGRRSLNVAGLAMRTLASRCRREPNLGAAGGPATQPVRGRVRTRRDGPAAQLVVSVGPLRVDVRWWVTQLRVAGRWIAGTHRVAVGLRGVRRPVRVVHQAALPHALGVDGAVAHLGKRVRRPSGILASCARRGCRGDQPACRQRGSKTCDDVLLRGLLLFRRSTGSVVDVRRWVIECHTPRVQVRAHQIAALVRGEVTVIVTGQAPVRRVEYHATLPGAVRLDGSVALADGPWSSVPAAGAGGGRCADQAACHQCGGQPCDEVKLHGMTLPLGWAWFAAFDVVIR